MFVTSANDCVHARCMVLMLCDPLCFNCFAIISWHLYPITNPLKGNASIIHRFSIFAFLFLMKSIDSLDCCSALQLIHSIQIISIWEDSCSLIEGAWVWYDSGSGQDGRGGEAWNVSDMWKCSDHLITIGMFTQLLLRVYKCSLGVQYLRWRLGMKSFQ